MGIETFYTSGAYLAKWPTWHVEESPWKARQILHMMERNQLKPRSICEVGCGAGEILKQLQDRMDAETTFWGYEISSQAFEICQSRANDRLHFKLADFTQEKDVDFDLILLIDVIEHVEDYLSFLRDVKPKGAYTMLHIPLDMVAKSIIQGRVLEMVEEHGHIHFFTKDIALRILKIAGYEVLDYFFTSPSLDLPTSGSFNEMRRRLMRLPRKLLFALNNDLAARTLGGYSLMVLAR